MTAQSPYSSLQSNLKCQGMKNWLDTELGQVLMQVEQQQVNPSLARLFGYHLLQIGNLGTNYLFHESRIKHKIVLDLYQSALSDPYSHLLAKADALPFENDSLDVVLLPHTLDFSDDPHQILREVERILIGEGHVIIVGFNPWSFWGIWKKLVSWRDQPPWNGQFFSQSRIKDWLELLGFEWVHTQSFFYRPALQQAAIMKHLTFLEKLGAVIAPYWGAVYLIVAKKKVESLTPVKMQWKLRRHKIASGVLGTHTHWPRDKA